jgi:hypothetical protein
VWGHLGCISFSGRTECRHRQHIKHAAVFGWQPLLSNVAFEAAHFQKNRGRLITTLSPDVQLHIKGSNFTDNKLHSFLSDKDLEGCVLLISNGTAVVESRHFSGNSVMSNRGAIAMENAASLQLLGSVLMHKTGKACMPSTSAQQERCTCAIGWV